MSTFDVLDFIMKVECDGVGDREYIDGVANLVKYGVINHLQGSWQRAAMGLVNLGYIDTAGNVLGYPEDSSSQRDACPRCGEEIELSEDGGKYYVYCPSCGAIPELSSYCDGVTNLLGYPPYIREERVEGYFDEEDEHPEAWKLGWVDHEEEPDSHNPFDAGSQDYQDWKAGWQAAVEAGVRAAGSSPEAGSTKPQEK